MMLHNHKIGRKGCE